MFWELLMIKIRDETIMDATYVNVECIHAMDSCWSCLIFMLCKVSNYIYTSIIMFWEISRLFFGYFSIFLGIKQILEASRDIFKEL